MDGFLCAWEEVQSGVGALGEQALGVEFVLSWDLTGISQSILGALGTSYGLISLLILKLPTHQCWLVEEEK